MIVVGNPRKTPRIPSRFRISFRLAMRKCYRYQERGPWRFSVLIWFCRRIFSSSIGVDMNEIMNPEMAPA